MHSRACWDEAAGSVDAHRTTPGMTERVCRSRVAASTTGLAEVGTEDRKVRSVDARLRRRRKLAPARSNSISLSIASSVSDTKPCPLTRSRMLAVNFPPPRGPCLAIRGRAFFSLAIASCDVKSSNCLAVPLTLAQNILPSAPVLFILHVESGNGVPAPSLPRHLGPSGLG